MNTGRWIDRINELPKPARPTSSSGRAAGVQTMREKISSACSFDGPAQITPPLYTPTRYNPPSRAAANRLPASKAVDVLRQSDRRPRQGDRQMSSALMSTKFGIAYAKDVTLIGIVDLGSTT